MAQRPFDAIEVKGLNLGMPSLHGMDATEFCDYGWVEVLVDRIRSLGLTKIVLDKHNIPRPIPFEMKKRSGSHRSCAVADRGVLNLIEYDCWVFPVRLDLPRALFPCLPRSPHNCQWSRCGCNSCFGQRTLWHSTPK